MIFPSADKRGRSIVPAVAGVLVACVLGGAMLWLTAHVARQASLQQLLDRDDHALQLYVANIRRELSQYAYLPKLLADDRRVLALEHAPRDVQQRQSVNHYLQFVARSSQAAVIYVMTRQGLTVASSNWDQADSFVGANYGFRPYFQQALHGQLGRYYALGSSSYRRGYYFAYPVRDGARVVGAVVVKVRLDSLETERVKRQYEFVVTDRHGIAFLSTRPKWRYHAFEPLAADTLFGIKSSQRYAGHALPLLAVSGRQAFAGEATLITLADSKTTYLKHGTYMPEAGWWVYILSATAPVDGYVMHAVLLASAILGSLILTVFMLWQWRVRVAERLHYEQAAAETAAVLDANRRLTHEIEEHQRTEVELRHTRNELVQAAKLAAIGELAAGINHELNQPLMSIRFFADNARTFLDRSRWRDARDNLLQIDALSAHMGKIIHQLKLFSRKSSGQLVPVSLAVVADGAAALLAPRLKREHVVVDWVLPAEDVYCLGDLVRLEQVVVNLVSNAIHAMSGQAQARVEVVVVRSDDRVVLSVRDYGPGIAQADLGQIFDPFFTTRDVGDGLGLGLSISMRIVEEMGGHMQACNNAEGGAVFTVVLPGATASENAYG